MKSSCKSSPVEPPSLSAFSDLEGFLSSLEYENVGVISDFPIGRLKLSPLSLLTNRVLRKFKKKEKVIDLGLGLIGSFLSTIHRLSISD